MIYSRRDFLKAAGSGVVLTVVAPRGLVAAPAPVPSLPMPFANEKASFLVNGKMYAAEYEARTTLWEVISMKLGLTGTNRSCNRASCGAVQRAGGRHSVLFLPHLGDRSRGPQDSHH